MKMIKKCTILLIFPLHLSLYFTAGHGYHGAGFYLTELLIMQLADFALSFWQMDLFTAKRNSIRVFAKDFLPYLLQNVLLIAAYIILILRSESDASILSSRFISGLAGCTAIIEVLLGALVTFVTGAARTMMYHDEKR